MNTCLHICQTLHSADHHLWPSDEGSLQLVLGDLSQSQSQSSPTSWTVVSSLTSCRQVADKLLRKSASQKQ